jgi:hypothetical protein
MRLSVLLAVLPVVLGAPAKRELAALVVPDVDADSLIADKYIVKFKKSGELSALNSALGVLSDAPDHIFKEIFQGFSATLDKDTLKTLREHPDVSEYPRMSFIPCRLFGCSLMYG